MNGLSREGGIIDQLANPIELGGYMQIVVLKARPHYSNLLLTDTITSNPQQKHLFLPVKKTSTDRFLKQSFDSKATRFQLTG
jgi:hypothetical protein